MKDNTLGKKLKEARKSLKMTQLELANAIGVSNASISGWEAGKNRPDAKAISSLCHILNITPAYLLNISDETLSPEEQNFLFKYRALDRYSLKAVQSLVNIEYARTQDETPEPEDNENTVILPLYTMAASAGTGQFLEDGYYENVAYHNPPKNSDFALRIAGDSMEPEFHHNDTVFVHKQSSLANGQIGIFIFNGEGYIKSLDTEGHALISLNQSYSPIVITASDDFRIVGRVLGKA